MKSTEVNQDRDRKYRLVLFLVIGLAAFSSAMKDLNQVQETIVQVGGLISDWATAVIPAVSARTAGGAANRSAQAVDRSDEFRWSGVVPVGQSIEIKGINGDINAEPASGDQVLVVALKTSRRSDVSSVQIKVVPHAGGVTICALYDGMNMNACEPSGNSSGSGSTGKNDVKVDFNVRVPRGVAFVGRTVNGDINATSLASNVVSRTVNGSIKISTTGYAEASSVNGGISARLGAVSWSDTLEFTTVNGEISLDLSPAVSTDVEARTLNGAISSDPLLGLTNMKNGKHLSGRIGAGGRKLSLKTVNGSINLRLSQVSL